MKFQHTLQLPESHEKAWKSYQAKNPGVTFNGFVISLLAAALKVKT